MCKTLWCLPSCTLRGETSDTRLLDMIFLLAFEISVGRQRIRFLTRVRYKYYNHVNAPANSHKHRWAFAFILASNIFLFCRVLPISHVVYNLVVPAWKGVAISILLCAAYICDLYGYEDNTKHYLQPTFISHLGSALHHSVHLLHTCQDSISLMARCTV